MHIYALSYTAAHIYALSCLHIGRRAPLSLFDFHRSARLSLSLSADSLTHSLTHSPAAEQGPAVTTPFLPPCVLSVLSAGQAEAERGTVDGGREGMNR